VITARTVLDWLRGCDLPKLWLSAKTSTDRRMVQHDSHAQTAARGWAFPVSGEVFMATDIKPLRDQIADASAELKLARRDGSAQRIAKAAKKLDELVDLIPRTSQPT
jgi:hypothetical protein